MQIIFSCVADEELQLSKECVEWTIAADRYFRYKNYGDTINKIIVCFVCTEHSNLLKLKKDVFKKGQTLELYPKLDRMAVKSYRNMDLRLLLGKYALDVIQKSIAPVRYFQADDFINDFTFFYNKEILKERFSLTQ